MADEAELQARIAAISGRINQHKQHQTSHEQTSPHTPPPSSQSSYRQYPRWFPYGRGGRAGYPPPHHNRTLVLSASKTQAPTEVSTEDKDEASGRFVSTRGTNKQLMTKETYEREAKQKLAQQKQLRLERQAKTHSAVGTRPTQTVQAPVAQSSNERELAIEGVRFRLLDDGSKFIRVADITTAALETPKKATVAGVIFVRTKHGNLARATSGDTPNRTVPRPQCEHFTKHGNCPFGPTCRFAHDPRKVAICKEFLRSGSCALGDNCDLSHEPTYHRVSACTHFLRGNCTNDACRYPHVNISPSAPVCRAFASLGYCPKGPACDKRHVTECPDYANRGHCANRENGKCLLPHPDRASTLRKAAERQAKMASAEQTSDISSDEEPGSDTAFAMIDSDVDEDMILGGSEDENRELTRQQDFVPFI